MDNNAFVFWIGPRPSLIFRESTRITYQGVNVCKIRKDIGIQELWAYIQSFYRSITPEALLKNICSLKPKDIITLTRGNESTVVFTKHEEHVSIDKSGEFPFQYKRELTGFNEPNAGRYLACLVLSESYPSCFLPIDLLEATEFYKENFTGNVSEVLEKYCTLRSLDSTELLSYYRHICETRRQECTPPVKEKTKGTIGVLVDTFLHLTR